MLWLWNGNVVQRPPGLPAWCASGEIEPRDTPLTLRHNTPNTPLPSASQPPLKIVVLDDDPTGSQTVHGCPLLLRWDHATLLEGLRHPSPLLFLLANTRALAPDAARQRVIEICRALAPALREAEQRGWIRGWQLVSRGDSTLRGHYPLEVDVLAAELGPFDATLLAPAFLEGGRSTRDAVHRLHGQPVHETPFARDGLFGYRHSDLRAWVEEKSGGRIAAASVRHLSLSELEGPPEALRARLARLSGNATVAVDAERPEHLEALAAALRALAFPASAPGGPSAQPSAPSQTQLSPLTAAGAPWPRQPVPSRPEVPRPHASALGPSGQPTPLQGPPPGPSPAPPADGWEVEPAGNRQGAPQPPAGLEASSPAHPEPLRCPAEEPLQPHQRQPQPGPRRFLIQSAAGLVGALAALPPQPLDAAGLAGLRRRDAHGRALPGLVLVGSHVPLADAQLERLLADPRCLGLELPVDRLQRVLEGPLPDRLLASLEAAWRAELEAVLTAGLTPVVFTSRGERRCRHAAERRALGLALAGLMARLAASLAPRLGYQISKGGITTHTLLADGLGAASVQLQGQLLPGLSLVLAGADALPVLTFPGNLGDGGTLHEAWRRMEDGGSA